MKALKHIALSVMCMTGSYASAQDMIVKKDGTVIQAKVTKIGTSEVEYKKWSNQDGPQYSIAISDILAINYKNGEKETFDNVGANVTVADASINTPKEEQPIIAPDNEKLINLYNNQVVQPVKPKFKDKLARRMFTVWGITDNSILSDSHISVNFSKIYSYDVVTGYAILVQNKSDETIYIDLLLSDKNRI